MRPFGRMREVSAHVAAFTDTCEVYVVRTGDRAILIDFGSGAVLDHLDELGVREVTDVLVTHHHRDQVQGLARAAARGIRIWVPPVEIDLIAHVDEHWRTRPLDNDYDLREDRFSLLEQVPVTGTVAEYRTRRYGDVDVYTLPTPGHTVGSVTYLVDIDGRRLAFVGDLVRGPGQVWSLAATQWTYTGIEGLAATVHSCQTLLDERPDVLLPSHGDPIHTPSAGLSLVVERLAALASMRLGRPWDPESRRGDTWETLTPHLLRNRTTFATTYALLSKDGTALFFDFGYDAALPMCGNDRACRRPLLSPLTSLRRDHGVERVEVAMPTHYHDDHVAGFNLLRDVEGTQIWTAETITPILDTPRAYDLPCLWYDPIRSDRVLPLGRPLRWREYELTVYELPGHTLYAVAIEVVVDGVRVVVTGDQQDGGWVQGERGEVLNYQYRNGFHYDDYIRSAELYRKLRPDLMISGHWAPRWVDEAYLDRLLADGQRLAELHRALLPLDEVDLGRFGIGTRIVPYRSHVPAGSSAEVTVLVRNPLSGSFRNGAAAIEPDTVVLDLVVPAGWGTPQRRQVVRLAPGQEARVPFVVCPPAGTRADRARIAVDLTVGQVRFGQVAEALVDVR